MIWTVAASDLVSGYDEACRIGIYRLVQALTILDMREEAANNGK